MDRETKSEVDRLMAKVDDPAIEQEVEASLVVDPMLQLKNTLLGFFSNRLEKIQEKETFMLKVQRAIEEKIDKEENMKIDDLLAIYKSISIEQASATEAILSLFRPSKDGVVTPLLTGEQKSDKVGDAFSNLNPEDQQKIDKLMRFLQQKGD